MSFCHWPLLLLLCAGTCAPPRAAVKAPPAPLRVEGELVFAGGELEYRRAGAASWRLTADAAPYQVVCLGPPALVTTAGSDLAVTTLAIGVGVHRYDGLYPLLAEPPLTALSGLPAAEGGVLTRTVLLDSDGMAVWSGDNASLLWPLAEPADSGVAYFAQAGPLSSTHGAEPDLLFPWGDQTRLLAVDAASGALRWEVPLEPAGPVGGVELWGFSGGYGLISLQYDYRVFEFIVFSARDGALGARHRLRGQPATQLVYPGAFNQPLAVTAADGTVSLGVYPDGGGTERWQFALASGELLVEPAEQSAPFAREDNDLPASGRGAPDPAAPPFPQALLPAAAGEAWQIPALVNSRGQVLVIDGGECRWISADSLSQQG
jgi:hypothetical protein